MYYCNIANKTCYISDCYMHELACIETQYMPIRIRCIGMYCGMYCGMYWWYVLNTCQHVFNTNRYVFNTYLSVLVCVVLVLGCGARTADPPVGGVGMDRVRTKHAVTPRRGPMTTTRHEARQTYATRPSTRRNGGSARPTRILLCNTHRGQGPGRCWRRT